METEKPLDLSLSTLDRVLGETSTALYLIDPEDGRIHYANRTACRRLGHQEPALESKSIPDISPFAFHRESLQKRLDTVRECAPTSFLTHHENADGDLLPVRVELDVIKQDSDEFILALSRSLDAINRPKSPLSDSKPSVSGGGAKKLKAKTDRGEFSVSPLPYSLSEDLFGLIQDGIFVTDAETGRIIDVNDTVTRWLEYDRKALFKLVVTDLVDPVDSLADWKRMVWRSAKQEGEIRVDLVRNDGSVCPVDCDHKVINWGNRTLFLTVAHEARKPDVPYRGLFDAVPDVITVHDPQSGEMIDVNETACEVLGYDRKDLLKQGLGGLGVVEEGFTRDRLAEIVEETVESDKNAGPYEWACRRKNGDILWLEVNPTVLQRRGEPYVVTINRDITRRKNDRQELEYRKSLLKAQQEAADEGILVVSTDDEILSYNQSFQEIWDVPDEVLETRDDREALEEATEEVYEKEFHTGVLNANCQDFSGEKVQDVKERLVEQF
ncbi:MAG: PAS domain S-box protein, partial [bacterium]